MRGQNTQYLDDLKRQNTSLNVFLQPLPMFLSHVSTNVIMPRHPCESKEKTFHHHHTCSRGIKLLINQRNPLPISVIVWAKGINLEPSLTFSHREGLASSPNQASSVQSPKAQLEKTSLLRQPDCLLDGPV